jgi:hypothetical protein
MCPQCKNILADGSQFCNKCGVKFAQKSGTSTVQRTQRTTPQPDNPITTLLTERVSRPADADEQAYAPYQRDSEKPASESNGSCSYCNRIVKYPGKLEVCGEQYLCSKCATQWARGKKCTVIFFIILLIIGAILTFTGVGAIVGVPFIGIAFAINSANRDPIGVYRVFRVIGIIILVIIAFLINIRLSL